MEKETPTQDRTLRLCMKVSGKAGDKTQEEVFLGFDAAVRQSDIFQAAGYKAVVIQPTHVAYDADDDKWYFAKIEGIATINESAVPAQYSRTNINPGISVYEYDRIRDREQYTTIKQLLVATMAAVAMVVAPGFFLGMLLSDSIGMAIFERGIFTAVCMIVMGGGIMATPRFLGEVFTDAMLLAGILWVDD